MYSGEMGTKTTLTRQRLGRELCNLRIAAGLTPVEAARLVGVHRSTVTRIENGSVEVKPERVDWMCQKYNATQAVRSALNQMAVRGNDEGWWERHKVGVVEDFQMYASAEREAKSLECFESEFLPGLVQTDGYIRALQPVTPQPAEGQELEERISARLDRQAEILMRRDLTIDLLMGIGCMGYLQAMPDVLDDQVARLTEIAAMPNVDLRVADKLHHAMGAAFTVVVMPDPEETFTYMDAMDGCRYVNDKAVVSSYRRAFRRAFETATPVKEHLK